MKKSIKLMFISVLTLFAVFSLAACETTEETGTTLVVGTPEISGNFMAGFGNSAYDVNVRSLINGYSTYATTPNGQIVLNETVVDSVDTTTSTRAVGSNTITDKTYTFVLHQDLVWNDGNPIKARDFVFGILMEASREWVAAGASSSTGDSLLGYVNYREVPNPKLAQGYDVTKEADFKPLTSVEYAALDPEDQDFNTYQEYRNDYEAKYVAKLPKLVNRTKSEGVKFEGVKLLSDYSFSVTIDGSKLPYFYERLYASFGPVPMHVLAPEGTTITSDAQGATVSSGGFSLFADVAKVGGYRYQPVVSAGQYSFVSFVNQVVTLKLNPTFKGNYNSDKATIDTIIMKRVNQTIDVDLVVSGELDLVTGVIEGAKIQKAQQAASTDLNYYSRLGYGLLAMVADFGPTQDYVVRQALAHLTDRQYVTDQVLEGYGSVTFSEYGLSQWMYVQSEDWVNDNLNKYNFSVTEANRLLNTTGWKFEADGTTAFDASKAVTTNNYFRHNAAGDKLVIKHFGTENNPVTDSLSAKFIQNMKLAGIEYTITIGTFDQLLDYYYYSYELADSQRVYHMFNLASNFSVAYDPYYSWHSDMLGSFRNAPQLEDSPTNPAAPLAQGERTLDELTIALRTVTPGDETTYLSIWREYQARWNKLIPFVPLYSNQYYDVFDANLLGVETTPFWDWTSSIASMRFK